MKKAQQEPERPVQTISSQSVLRATADPQVNLRELYFLIGHFLSSGPCKTAADALKLEAAENDLLPRRAHAFYSRTKEASGLEADNGKSVPMAFEEVAARHPDIGPKHLEGLLLQLMQSTAANQARLDGYANRTLTAADTNSILGTGAFSLLDKERAAAKQQGDPPNLLRWPFHRAGPVRSLLLREVGGGFPSTTNRLPARKAGEYTLGNPSLLVERLEHLSTLRGHRNAVYCTVLDRSGRFAITGSDDFLVKIWSMTGNILLRTCRGHTGDITDLTVSADNKYIASSSNDHSIRVWSLPFGVPISVLKGHANPVTAVQFSPRAGFEHHLLSASEDNTCRVWDARSSKTKPHVYVPKPLAASEKAKGPKDEVLCASYNPDGRFFVTGSTDKMTRVWLAPEFADLATSQGAPVHELAALAGHENHVNYVQFSGCNMPANASTATWSFRGRSFQVDPLAAFIVSCSRDGSAIIWAPRKSHSKLTGWVKAHSLMVPGPPVPPPRHFPRQPLPTPRGVNMIVWSLDNRFVLAAIMDCRICVWNAVDGSLVHSLTGHTQATYVLDIHPTDPRVALSAGYDGKLIVWDIWGGRALRTLQVNDLQLVDARFSPDGTAIIASNEIGEVYYYGTGTRDQCKGAKDDQFFLGDYLETVEDAEGYVMDLAMDIPAHLRNLQDPLCNAQMEPYPEPFQYAYQSERIRAFGGVEALHGAGLPVPLVRMPTADVVFQAQAAASQPLRHHVWMGHEDGPRLEPAPLPPPLPPAPRQQVIWREDFEEEANSGDESGSASFSDEEGRAPRRNLRPVSRRPRNLLDGEDEPSGRSDGRRSRPEADAPSTSRFGRVLKRKQNDDYESLSEGREEAIRRPITRRQRHTLQDDDEWQDDFASSSSSEEEEEGARGRARAARRRQRDVSKELSDELPEDGAIKRKSLSKMVDVDGVVGWASKKKRRMHKSQAGPRNPEEGAGLDEALGGASFGPLDGRQLARLGGLNDLHGVQLRSLVSQPSRFETGFSSVPANGGVTREKGLTRTIPQLSAFGTTTEPKETVSPKPSADVKTIAPTKIKRIRVNPPKEKIGAQPLPPRHMPPPINEPRTTPPKQAKENTLQKDGLIELIPRPQEGGFVASPKLDSPAQRGGTSSPILAPPLHFLSPIKSAFGQPLPRKDEEATGKAKKSKQKKGKALQTTLSESGPAPKVAAYTEVRSQSPAHNLQSRAESPRNLQSFQNLPGAYFPPEKSGLRYTFNPQHAQSAPQNPSLNPPHNPHQIALQNLLQHPPHNPPQNPTQNLLQKPPHDPPQTPFQNSLRSLPQNPPQKTRQTPVQNLLQNPAQNLPQNLPHNPHQNPHQNPRQNPHRTALQNLLQTNSSHLPSADDPLGTLSFLSQLSSGLNSASGGYSHQPSAFANLPSVQIPGLGLPAVSATPSTQQGLREVLQHLSELRGPVEPRDAPSHMHEFLARQRESQVSPLTAYHGYYQAPDPLLGLELQAPPRVPQELAEHAIRSGSGLQQEGRYPDWMLEGLGGNGLRNDKPRRQ